MKRIIFLILTLTCTIFLMAGCGSVEPEKVGEVGGVSAESQRSDSGVETKKQETKTPESQPQDVKTAEENQETDELEAVLKHFEKNGLSIGDKITKAYEMLGAIDGFGIIVEGHEVELYLFDPETADEKTTESLKSANEKGEIEFYGIKLPVVMNGNIMLTRIDEHAHKEKIIEIFKKY